ncbi:MAG TPA: hypothetical protein VJC06_03245 [Candidatus Paceibacterota bacterium]
MEKVTETKIESPQNQPEEVQTWEGEGGAVEAQEQKEIQETKAEQREEKDKQELGWKQKYPEKMSGKAAFRMMGEAGGEFTDEISQLLDKKFRKGMLNSEEQNRLNKARTKWFKERFGIEFEKRKQLKELREMEKTKLRSERKKEQRAKKFGPIKEERMHELHQALQNLDKGEIVEQFEDETRRIIYYDEGVDGYFIENENGDKRKYLGVGDILADYAWGIKYVPDGEMTEPAYRTAAKRILVNETRRDIERIYDEELSMRGVTKPMSLYHLEKRLTSKEGRHFHETGIAAEKMARELLTRISVNEGLNFVVMRANAVEDSIYKYDFKLRTIEKDRGVVIENPPLKHGSIRLGIQFTISKLGGNKKNRQIRLAKSLLLEHEPVDDIILVKIATKEFAGCFQKWLEMGKPSGGPEQFLSRNLKIEILKAVTKNLTEISDKEIERIFPKTGEF